MPEKQVALSSISSNHSESLEHWPWEPDLVPSGLLVFEDPDNAFPRFVPPPPRPLFLSDVALDGVTTCDTCSWAMKGRNAVTIEGREAAGELGWVLTLVIVSLSSALIGAVIMIIVLHCKSRLKNSSASETECGMSMHQQQLSRPRIHTPENKQISTITQSDFAVMCAPQNGNGVWSWLARTRRSSTSPANLQNSAGSQVRENHYTHMEDQYNVAEALYAELDRESLEKEERASNNSPAYQNSAYTDPDAPSGQSSAYYSDLSVTPMPERAYEVLPSWDPCGLAAITEHVNAPVPSDYV